MRGRTTSTCDYCGKSFSHVLSKTPKYCSIGCKANAQKKTIKCICLVCGKEYEVFKRYNSGAGSKFCSQKCRSSQKIEKVCKTCGQTFKVKPSIKSQEFCNNVCRKFYTKELCKKTCDYCGEIFYTKASSAQQRFCSNLCYSLSSTVIKTCYYCGKSFETKVSKKQKYCSLECSNAAPHKVKVLVKNTLDRIASGAHVSKTELLLKEDLEKNGFVSQYISSFGSIDFADPKNKIAVFVDGVFWHGRKDCHWKNTSFKAKIEKTMMKDVWQNTNMPKHGWIVLRYWDDYVRKHTDECVADILSYLNITK